MLYSLILIIFVLFYRKKLTLFKYVLYLNTNNYFCIQKSTTMAMTSTRPTSVRFSESFYNRIQSAAAKDNRSVSNWILMAVSSFLDEHEEYVPNEVTVAAIEEARSLQKAYSEGKLVPEPVDLTSVESMLKSFGVKKEETN